MCVLQEGRRAPFDGILITEKEADKFRQIKFELKIAKKYYQTSGGKR